MCKGLTDKFHLVFISRLYFLNDEVTLFHEMNKVKMSARGLGKGY